MSPTNEMGNKQSDRHVPAETKEEPPIALTERLADERLHLKTRYTWQATGFVQWILDSLTSEAYADEKMKRPCCGLSDATKCLGCGITHDARRREYIKTFNNYRSWVEMIKGCLSCSEYACPIHKDYTHQKRYDCHSRFRYKMCMFAKSTYSDTAMCVNLVTKDDWPGHHGWQATLLIEHRALWHKYILAEEEKAKAKEIEASAPALTSDEGQPGVPAS